MNPQLPDWNTLRLVMPEIWLVIGMCAVILVPFIKRASAALPAVAALICIGLAIVSTLGTLATSQTVFSDMLAIDPFSQFFKLMLLVFTALVIVQWWIGSRERTHVYDMPDFLCLLLGAAFGMSLMASAQNLLMIVIAMESASLPSFALAGFRKSNRIASEGSLKYVVFGAAASAIMIYGMSLIFMTAGSLALPSIAAAAEQGVQPILAIGLMAMLVGIAFKLSVVPVHFWCPDVFEGAPVEVTTFLSVASKGAAVCLLVRVLSSFGAPVGEVTSFAGLGVAVAIVGGVTACWGNLVALHQTNIKRLLAYSSIAHAGYMTMAASLLVSAADRQAVTGALLFYLLIYMFMNLGAFTTASLIYQQSRTEDIREYVDLKSRSPVLAVLLTVFLLSLFGMPTLGGFMGKVFLMVPMTEAGVMGGVLIAVLLINTLISFYYYARPVYYMMLLSDTANRPIIMPRALGVGVLLLCLAVIVWTGLLPEGANKLTRDFATLYAPSQPQLEPAEETAALPAPSAAAVSINE